MLALKRRIIGQIQQLLGFTTPNDGLVYGLPARHYAVADFSSLDRVPAGSFRLGVRSLD